VQNIKGIKSLNEKYLKREQVTQRAAQLDDDTK